MSQRIFDVGLSTETISLYLLACGLADGGNPITRKNLIEIWNGTAEQLEEGLRILESRHILTPILSAGDEAAAYRLTEVRSWKTD
jgi:hypothetical protein